MYSKIWMAPNSSFKYRWGISPDPIKDSPYRENKWTNSYDCPINGMTWTLLGAKLAVHTAKRKFNKIKRYNNENA